jgi:hypothetical protein
MLGIDKFNCHAVCAEMRFHIEIRFAVWVQIRFRMEDVVLTTPAKGVAEV